MLDYLPEGLKFCNEDNKMSISGKKQLQEARLSGKILEAVCVVCDKEHNLIVDLGCMKGVIPREEGALGISEGHTRDIALISRVNKPVSFKVTGFSEDAAGHQIAVLSRRNAQKDCFEKYIKNFVPGDILKAKVTHLEQFGAFVDIGCGIISLIPIDLISVSRISHPADRFYIGQDIFAVLKTKEQTQVGIEKITLTHKELLGNWMENVSKFAVGETVTGIVRGIESYGIFVELTPNLAGLAELRDDLDIGVNQQVSVYIKAVIPEKMKIKLAVVGSFEAGIVSRDYDYTKTSGRIDKWVYSSPSCEKMIFTDFNQNL